MKKPISRRTFLKTGITTAGAVMGLNRAAGAGDTVRETEHDPLATLIDIRKCTGCEECVAACARENEARYPQPVKPFPRMYPSRVPVEDWSDKQDVTDRLTPYNWLFIQHASATFKGETIELTLPRRCMHCANPPCVKLCPWGAAKQEKNGLSRIDSGLCLGGAKCQTVCPWEIPQRQTGVGPYLDLLPALAGNGVMYKCNRCHQRIEKNERPACIDACPEEAQIIGPRSEILKRAHALAKEINGYIYGEDENGGTHTIYVSPVPFGRLNQAVETGEGRPGLDRVKNMMASGTQLAKAMLIAPFAGLAAAFGKFYLAGRKEEG